MNAWPFVDGSALLPCPPLFTMPTRTVGVLGMQGAFQKHIDAVRACGHEAFWVREPTGLERIDALILPGGESTTVGKLLNRWGLADPLRRLAGEGLPLFGTCAGMIVMARALSRETRQPRLAVMDVVVERNAYGRQVDSFEADLSVPCLGAEPFRGVFIRAPRVVAAGPGVDVLARLDGDIVFVRQNNLLAAAFHPELTDDLRVHRYFLDLVAAC